jgi:FkbM family methyltransferase
VGAPEKVSERARLHCEVAVPSGIRQGRVFVRLRQPEPEVLELLPARGIGDATHQIINVWGRPLLTHVADADPVVSGEMYRSGYWEFAQSVTLLSLARPGMTVVDAGAHVGYYAMLLAPTLGADGHLYAFEPEPRNVLALTANALLLRQLFPQAATVTVFPCALSEDFGSGRLNIFDQNSAIHSLVHGTQEAVTTKSVPVSTLDALSAGDGEPGLGRGVDLIKVDVCGSELSLLKGAQRMLQDEHPSARPRPQRPQAKGGGQRTSSGDRPVLCLDLQLQLQGPEGCMELVHWLAHCGYRNFRLFQADAADPYQLLVETVPVWTADEVVDQIRRKLIAAHATLLAFPESGTAIDSSQ